MRHLLFTLAASVLLLAIGQRSEGQKPDRVPTVPATKQIEPSPAKELSQKEIDALIEKAFGKESAEIKRSVRIWFRDVDMVIAAEKAVVVSDYVARFSAASIVSVVDPAAGIKLRGNQMVVEISRTTPYGSVKPAHEDSAYQDRLLSDLKKQSVMSIEVLTKSASIILGPRQEVNTTFATVGSKIGSAESPLLEPPVFVSGGPSPNGRALEMRFKFKIDPKTPLADLLPRPVKATPKLPHWTNEDLAKIPDLTIAEPLSKKLSKQDAMETTAHAIAKINHLNAKKRDGFMLAMLQQRPDLRGLPFLMGDDCRTREEQAKAFTIAVNGVRQHAQPSLSAAGFNGVNVGDIKSAYTAALMQVHMPASEKTAVDLAETLSAIPHVDATKALAKLAIYSPQESVRAAAIEGLKLRRERDYTDVLVQGFRYPLPAVSKRAAEALVKLERKDLVADLIAVLEAADPRLPVTEKRDGKDVTFVRELVKVNHHRNCLLCHAPGNTADTPEGVLKVAVPLPSEPLPKPEQGGYQSTPPPSPDIVVRIDMTYLRQDFSMMMPVADAHPWPEMQRFDFLVRKRELTAAETQAYEPCGDDEDSGRLSPYHRAALYALRELTGRDTAPTAAAWRKMLKLPAR